MSDSGLSCVYCGERHANAAEVRRCWERVTDADGSSPSSDDPVGALVAADAQRSRVGWFAPVLGRSVVVEPGEAPPHAWATCDRTGGGTDELEQAWRERIPVVIEAGDDPDLEETESRPVWSLTPSFGFPGERRAHAMFANSVDARHGEIRWRWAEAALRLGAAASPRSGRGEPADVVLPDGTPALCDGGPLEWNAGAGEVGVVSRLSLLAGSLVAFGVNDTSAELAPDQLAAVLHRGGSARIIAPAGSGKTRVLTERARHLLRQWRLPGRAVTLVAFNRRAADEMRERTVDLPELQVRTLNALGLSLLGGSRPVTTIGERDVRAILDTLVDLPRRANADPAAAWIEALAAVRLGLQDPAAVEAEFGGDVDGLSAVFERYRSALSDRGLVDFDEQIYRAIETLLADPATRRTARGACRALLVDEFQDLTPAHLLLVRLLAGPDGAVFGVGDDDQTIYGYSGASPEWLIDYRRYFPGAGAHPLEINYRSPAPVVDAARSLLTHNRRRVEKEIAAAPGRSTSDGGLALAIVGDPLTATVEAVCDRVVSGTLPADIAVLTRVNASLAPVQVALVHRAIPVQPAVDTSYLTRGGVQAALAWLRLAISPPERLAGADVALAARRPSRALSPRVIEWMREQCGVSALSRLADRAKPRDAEKILAFVADLEAVRRSADSGTTADVLRAVRDDVGLDRAMELLEGARRHLDRSAQTDDLEALVALAALRPDPRGFEEWLRASLSRPGSPDGVTLATIHRVKGREWPHVVLHDVSEALVPHRLASDVEEERRVFHVGLTRGSSSVLVVAGPSPSPFLAELTEAWRPGRPSVPRPMNRPMGGSGPPGSRSSATAAGTAARSATRAVKGPAGVERPGAAVQAVVGLEFGHRGHRYRVTAVDDEGVVAAVGKVTTHVAFDELVTVDGRGVRLAAVPVPSDVADVAREALRAWRSARVAAEKKPAYVFLHDRTIEELATRMPSAIAALARIDGIGPGKLASYGEELLALLEAARDRATDRALTGSRVMTPTVMTE